jgi:hypothetical protein
MKKLLLKVILPKCGARQKENSPLTFSRDAQAAPRGTPPHPQDQLADIFWTTRPR